MKNSLETRIGIFVALVMLAAVFILDIVGGAEKFTRGHRLHAIFTNVEDLKVGDRVKMEMSPYDLDKARIVWRLR